QKIKQPTLTLTGLRSTAAYNSTFTLTPGGGTSSSSLFPYTTLFRSNVGNLVTMTSGTGTCTVAVDRAGDNNYNAATQVTAAATATKINQSTLTLTGVPSTAAYNATFTVTPGGGSGSASLVVSASVAC